VPNGLRYPLVGGMRQRHFDGTNFKPRKLLKNAQTPTSRVHAVLGKLAPTKTIIEKRISLLTRRIFTNNLIFGNHKKLTYQNAFYLEKKIP